MVVLLHDWLLVRLSFALNFGFFAHKAGQKRSLLF